uniref:Mitotic spindle organizing protein 1 n=1 Tax=Scleropages formosus TaxID=113540 RepID=A0A8C9W1G7_SCLFO
MATAQNMNAVRETMDVLLEISKLLNTGLDMESLSICVRLCEQGINPEALSSVIKELRKASDTFKVKPPVVIIQWRDSDCHLDTPLDSFQPCPLLPLILLVAGPLFANSYI